MLTKHNNEMTIESIMKMDLEELQDAVIRMFSVREVNADEWNGKVYIPDELADAFRNRN